MSVPLFSYTEKDVYEGLARRVDGFEQSKLDELIYERWDSAMLRGTFRYDLSGVTTRQIPGEFGFIVQQNPKRFTHRRPPMNMASLRENFDPSCFNFNKVTPDEVLFEVCCDDQEERHLMVINVSPITYGHTLLVPAPKDCLPQVLTEKSIQLCLDLVALSGHSGFCIVANSLLAYASVNHLHYHILYVKEPVLAATVQGRRISHDVYELMNHPSPGFGFEVVASSQTTGASEIFKVVQLLLESDIPHNMVILRGSPFNQDDHSHHNQVIRTLLIPRKPFYGDKLGSSLCPPAFSPAACELAQGFIPVLDKEKYHTLTEKEILQVLREKIISKDDFQSLLEKVKQF